MALDVVSAVEMEVETALGVHSGRSAMSKLDYVMRQSFTCPLFLVFLCRSDINLRSCRFIAPSSYLMACVGLCSFLPAFVPTAAIPTMLYPYWQQHERQNRLHIEPVSTKYRYMLRQLTRYQQ
jgi:hypothetical protein